MTKRYQTGDILRAAGFVYGADVFSRNDILTFLAKARIGEGGGPRGARLFSLEEVEAVVALLPISQQLARVELLDRPGEGGAFSEMVRRQAVLSYEVNTSDADGPCWYVIPPRGFSGDVVTDVKGLATVHPHSTLIDVRRIRKAVRDVLAEPGTAPWVK